MDAETSTAPMQVPPRLRTAEAAGLKAMLSDRRGRPVALDFANVTQIGTQCFQVLLAAADAWRADDVAFEVRNMPEEVRDSLRVCGLGPAQIGAKETNDDA